MLFELDIRAALEVAFVPVILALLLVDVFDTAGTLVAVSQRAGLTDDKGNIKNLRGALLADSSATMLGSLLGTSSTTSYIESSAGVEAGGRTGLTAILVGMFFCSRSFWRPLRRAFHLMQPPQRSSLLLASWWEVWLNSTGRITPTLSRRFSARWLCPHLFNR